MPFASLKCQDVRLLLHGCRNLCPAIIKVFVGVLFHKRKRKKCLVRLGYYPCSLPCSPTHVFPRSQGANPLPSVMPIRMVFFSSDFWGKGKRLYRYRRRRCCCCCPPHISHPHPLVLPKQNREANEARRRGSPQSGLSELHFADS